MDRRVVFRKSLSPLYLPYYDALCAELPDEWQPYCGYRSKEEQDALFKKGRNRHGDILSRGHVVTYARGMESPHNYGCATEWTIFDGSKPVWLDAADPRWQTYGQACDKVGLEWGGHFKKFPDLFHNELSILLPWTAIKQTWERMGEQEALKLIRRNILR